MRTHLKDVQNWCLSREAINEWLYLERFVNNGSPTGLTFSATSSIPTSPLFCSGAFRLPFVSISFERIKYLNGQWFNTFRNLHDNEVCFPIHPDLIPLLYPDLIKQVVIDPLYVREAIPTASPRSVFVVDDINKPRCLKLDYPLALGRFPSDLAGEKLFAGPLISKYLESLGTETILFFLPEEDAIETSIFSDLSRSGAVLRTLEVKGTSGQSVPNVRLIPAFSLFSEDRLDPDKKPLIALLLEEANNPFEYLVENILDPLLKSYWYLSLNHGLIPEAHAQNFLYGYREGVSSPILVWRDFQGFYRDEALLNNSLKNELGIKYHSIAAEDHRYAQQRRSFLYDWILGHYFFDPLISTVQSNCHIDSARIVEHIRGITHQHLATLGFDYLPINEWYSMSLDIPKKDKLGMLVNNSPLYR